MKKRSSLTFQGSSQGNSVSDLSCLLSLLSLHAVSFAVKIMLDIRLKILNSIFDALFEIYQKYSAASVNPRERLKTMKCGCKKKTLDCFLAFAPLFLSLEAPVLANIFSPQGSVPYNQSIARLQRCVTEGCESVEELLKYVKSFHCVSIDSR